MSKKYKGYDSWLNTASRDPYISLATAIVYSGVVTEDENFLSGEWCEYLLHHIGCGLTGNELLAGYRERRERVWRQAQQRHGQN